ncbi:Laccase-14 [Ananas comosus]|uniref:Laccase n=1 Tax=Ananas comosus TaxID=4615 RepID=A0A199W075_ANACO|nr:Laccase-14 [Ananas comosus]
MFASLFLASHVGNMTITKLCQTRVITAVNQQMPGPTLEVSEGDKVIIHVLNHSPYNMTIHWHGVFQKLSGWADGPNMITQCPIQPGNKYTYKFNIIGQEGTLWWHAHVSFHRATVYGVLIILPREGPHTYPFPKPHHEVPILLGEWWNANVVDLADEAYVKGGAPNKSDVFTINGKPGDFYNCSEKDMYKLKVEYGKKYMFRIINAALNSELFFKVAGHNFTVMAVDASYTNPYKTDVIVIAPGQTVDALMAADAAPDKYYMAALRYEASGGVSFDNTTTRGIVEYYNTSPTSQPVMPTMPAYNDTLTANRFYTNLTGLLRPGKATVPLTVNHRMFVTFGFGRVKCESDQLLCNQTTGALAASMNNVSFQFPSSASLLAAHDKNLKGIYMRGFPDKPPVFFDFTNESVNTDPALTPLVHTLKGTKVTKVKYNSTVEMVLQNTAIVVAENHPLHLHGFNFYVLAQGLGNYNKSEAVEKYNLVDPQVRNTIAVPGGGWAVIRFKANNPGVWIMHCHLDAHLQFGLATAFEVENGPTPDTILPPPPPDYPKC